MPGRAHDPPLVTSSSQPFPDPTTEEEDTEAIQEERRKSFRIRRTAKNKKQIERKYKSSKTSEKQTPMSKKTNRRISQPEPSTAKNQTIAQSKSPTFTKNVPNKVAPEVVIAPRKISEKS